MSGECKACGAFYAGKWCQACGEGKPAKGKMSADEAVELANRESTSSWRDFLVRLKQRGLRGVELAVTDDHAGLKKGIVEVLPETAWQRCYVHFLRNALDYLPRMANDDCLVELRWLTVMMWSRHGGIWRCGWRSGRPSIPSCAIGWKPISRKRSRSTGCRSSTTST